jgi:urate oxidase/2-oxo-4-hydroxy-4-carboxy-5-ureidoimidazoline decarboxylase
VRPHSVNHASATHEVGLERFASGWKRNYYGKADVTAFRLQRDGRVPEGGAAVFGANVTMLLYGDAFWSTYTTGDNTGLIATDSMKNFIQRETANFPGCDLDAYCRFLAETFLARYPQVEGLQVSATEVPYASRGTWSFSPAGPERATARIELTRSGCAEATSGISGFRLLRLGGSAFTGFVRDEYTTLPEIRNRPLHMWLDLEWQFGDPAEALNGGSVTRTVSRLTHEVFDAFESGSIQQVIHALGTRVLDTVPTIGAIHLEANNRTWDTVSEQGDALGIYTDARPPYGCLGLSLRR